MIANPSYLFLDTFGRSLKTLHADYCSRPYAGRISTSYFRLWRELGRSERREQVRVREARERCSRLSLTRKLGFGRQSGWQFNHVGGDYYLENCVENLAEVIEKCGRAIGLTPESRIHITPRQRSGSCRLARIHHVWRPQNAQGGL